MQKRIQDLVDEYRLSKVQSEAEVRSKFIVPLLDILGYPSYLRAEEFPVYGHEGRKALPAKNADFVLFSDRDFACHREKNAEHTTWVKKHSLLIVEAKKPGELPENLGQPQFYTVWTRAVAYLATDGAVVKGYYYNPINADPQVIDCTVEDLPTHNEILALSYENILKMKLLRKFPSDIQTLLQDSCIEVVESASAEGKLRLVDAKSISLVKEEEVQDFPEHSINYMKNALGRNAEGLTNLQLMARFLSTTDMYLQNNMRYDVPKYMFNFPRNIYKAHLYMDNAVFPIDIGEVREFYWNDCEKYYFQSNHIHIAILSCKGKTQQFEVGYQVLDNSVLSRMEAFKKVDKVLHAKTLRLSLDDAGRRQFILPTGKPKKMWKGKAYSIQMSAVWQKRLEQMRIIEEYYGINFKLRRIDGGRELQELYDAVSVVYNGIALNENCEITLPAWVSDEDIVISEPTMLEEKERIPLPLQHIHGICFAPYQSWLLPGKIPFRKAKSEDVVRVPGCCRYKILDESADNNRYY